MKKQQTLLIALAIACSLSACKKSGTTEAPSTIVGKWKEIKIHIIQTGSGSTKDNTFNADELSNADYAIFNTEAKAIFSFAANNAPPVSASPDWISIENYGYLISGSTLTLVKTDLPASQANGIAITKTETILQLDDKNLVLHESYVTGLLQITTETYFVRE